MFVIKVKKEVEKILKKFEYSSNGDAFVHWCIKIMFDFDDDDITQYTAIGGKGDKSIDAFFTDDDTKTICIIQGRFSEKGKAKVDRKEIAAFGESKEWLHRITDKYSLKNEKLYEFSIEYKEKIQEEFGTKLIFFCFGEFTQDAIEESNKFNNENASKNNEMELIDIKKIEDIYNSYITASESAPNCVISIIDEFFQKNKPVRAIVATAKAKEIAQIRLKNGTSIYRSNVRYFLGKNRINENISNTIQDGKQKQKFWYFNNGLSIVCKTFDLKNNKLNLEGMQIVNGCQTTEVLKDNFGYLDENTEILIRVVESKDSALISKITEYTNTQNPTTPRDLMSNDDIQNKLQKEFLSFSSPIFFEVKRGGWKAYLETLNPKKQREYKRKYQKINNEKVAQAYWAFMGNPASAKSEKGMLFISKDQKGYYEKIFNKDRTIEELYLPYKIFEYCREQRLKKIKELKKKEEKVSQINIIKDKEDKIKEIAVESFIFYADFTFISGIGYILNKHFGDFNSINYDELLNKFDDIIPKLYQKVFAELKYISEDIFKPGFSYNNFYKSRDALEKCVKEIDRAINRCEADGKSYFDILKNTFLK